MDYSWTEFKWLYLQKPKENPSKNIVFGRKKTLEGNKDIDWRESGMVSEVKD